MDPRVLFRTHYQVDEPALMELIIRRCTSATKSAYNDSVRDRIAREMRRLGKPLNRSAAGYAVDLAHGLGLVTSQNAWTDKGHLTNLIATFDDAPWDEQVALTDAERLLHLRLFVEADGAALLHIGRLLVEHGKIPGLKEDWNALARDMFVAIYSESLKLSGTTTDRVRLRSELDRIKGRGYAGKSGAHKMFVHLQTLHRIGLVDRANASLNRQYEIQGDGTCMPLNTLVEQIKDLRNLERVVKEHRIVEVCAKSLGIATPLANEPPAPEQFMKQIAPVYRELVATHTPLAPLTTLIETVQIRQLASGIRTITYDKAIDLLRHVQRSEPAEVRFHVDRRGSPAFLKLSERLAEREQM